MTIPIRNAKDFWAGLIYVLVGAATVVLSREFGMGTATKMGPAYFPTVLGGLLVLIGAIAIVRSFIRSGEPPGALALQAVLLVCGGGVLFAVLLRPAGLVVAITALVLVSAYASRKFHVGVSAALAAGLALFCSLIFVKGLGIPLPLFGYWFGG